MVYYRKPTERSANIIDRRSSGHVSTGAAAKLRQMELERQLKQKLERALAKAAAQRLANSRRQ